MRVKILLIIGCMHTYCRLMVPVAQSLLDGSRFTDFIHAYQFLIDSSRICHFYNRINCLGYWLVTFYHAGIMIMVTDTKRL